jgi:hypothetical protein
MIAGAGGRMASPQLRFHELRSCSALHHHRARPFACARGANVVSGAVTAGPDGFLQRPKELLQQAAAAVLIPAVLNLSQLSNASAVELTAAQPIYDGAKIVSSELRPKLSQKLADFEE